jgi:hypothetical protein
MATPEDIAKLCHERGIDLQGSKGVVTSCGSGVTASVVLLALYSAGMARYRCSSTALCRLILNRQSIHLSIYLSIYVCVCVFFSTTLVLVVLGQVLCARCHSMMAHGLSMRFTMSCHESLHTMQPASSALGRQFGLVVHLSNDQIHSNTLQSFVHSNAIC